VNIAVVVSGGITETILATPLLGTLRHGNPEGRICVFCPSAASSIAEGLAGADEVVPLHTLNGHGGIRGAIRLWYSLRRRRLDAVAVCSQDAGAGVAAYLSGTPQRAWSVHGPLRWLASAAAPPGRTENVARSWLRMARVLGMQGEQHKPEFEPGPEARARAEAMLSSSALADGRLLIAIAPGSGFAEPRGADGAGWDPERYAHLANQLAARHGAGIALIGSIDDRDAIERTKLDLSATVVDLSGATDPRTVAAVLARCDLLIGTDTPMLHLAAAVGTPTVGLFGPTDGVRHGPYGSDHRVIQALGKAAAQGRRAAEPASVEQIRVEDVLASIESTF